MATKGVEVMSKQSKSGFSNEALIGDLVNLNRRIYELTTQIKQMKASHDPLVDLAEAVDRMKISSPKFGFFNGSCMKCGIKKGERHKDECEVKKLRQAFRTRGVYSCIYNLVQPRNRNE